MSRRLRGPALAAAGLLLALCSAELAHRVWSRVRGAPFDHRAVEERLGRLADVTAAFVPGGRERETARGERKAGNFGILHPFYGSEHHHDTGDVLRWFRERPPEDDSFTVLVLGGSVAAGWSADVQRAFASRLEADPRLAGRTVQVLRYAHAAYKQPQQVTRLAYLFSFGYRPDLVINLDGFNEVASSVSNALEGTHPNYPSAPVWAAVLRDRREVGADGLDALVELRDARNAVVGTVDRALRWNLARSSLLALLVERRVGTQETRAVRAMERYRAAAAPQLGADPERKAQMHGPPYDRALATVLRTAADCWREGSLSMHALCTARGIPYLHCLQPALMDPGAKIVTDEERAIGDGPPGWRDAVEQGYPLLRAAGERLVEQGVAFADVSQSFADVDQTLYYDPCHFHAPGNLILSAAIAPHALAALPPGLVSAR